VFPLSLRFPGQVLDKETNLHYNYFRDYDPGIGRYIQSDPIGVLGLLRRQNPRIVEQDLHGQFLISTFVELPSLRQNTYGYDSSQSAMGGSGGISLYSYVKGNPLKWSDPKGLDIFPPERGGRGAGGGGCRVMIDQPIGPVFDAAHNWLFFCVWICSTASCPPKFWFRSAVIVVTLDQGCPSTPP
jgi:hypothetical protein